MGLNKRVVPDSVDKLFTGLSFVRLVIKSSMGKIAIAVHGGAGPDSDFIKQNAGAYKKGINKP